MKYTLHLILFLVFFYSFHPASSQVTQINNNNSLQVNFPLSNNKTIVVSDIDSSIWATDATLPGTLQISPNIKLEELAGLISGKLVFRGSTATTGSEIYITDGTSAGTVLVKDIYAGTTSSAPGDFSFLNGFVYFSARTAAEGRELWRTNGTLAGTTLVKDIVPGPDSSNTFEQYHLFSNGSYLLFAAKTASAGIELWKSDGTNAGTVLLKDINTGNAGADSSNPGNFYVLNNIVLFTAKDAPSGGEIWKTDGTTGGTVLVKDINPGVANSTSFELFPGFTFGIFNGFHTFNNRAYFNATDGTSTGEVWGTDGTTANTTLLKNIVPGTSFSFIFLLDAVNLPSKFIFPVSDNASRFELWESDGTPGGTQLFKAFAPSNIPLIFVPYIVNYSNATVTQTLFQGNKFFFSAGTSTEGYELWISDGTLAGTNIVKDINPGIGDGIDLTNGFSYVYTTNELFFAANNGVLGNELWKSNGTLAGTSLVKDINPNTGNSNPELILVSNGKIIFSATDGDNQFLTDLFVVDGIFTALPLQLLDFNALIYDKTVRLNWSTTSEINTKYFEIERSKNGIQFETIGSLNAAGNSSLKNDYRFNDVDAFSAGSTKLFYRLKVVDRDSKFSYSKVVVFNLDKDTKLLYAYPNPVIEQLSVTVNSAGRKQVMLQIADENGKLIYSKGLNDAQGSNKYNVNVSQFAKGIYYLTLVTDAGVQSVKFMKN